MESKHRPTVLCVDDEPDVLEGLSLHLMPRYSFLSAQSAAEALIILAREKDIAVVLSDMRMPKMNGAEFLRQARQLRPEAVRMLLTGQSDLDSAISAVNEGQLFRFLTKPCPPSALIAAIEAAIEQHRLQSAERVLLEQTLLGSVKALCDVLALTSPALFGRAGRVKTSAVELARAVGLTQPWRVEVAAMLAQLGAVALPAELADRISAGREPTEAEQRLMARSLSLTEQILGHIPRLESVRAMLQLSARPRRTAPAGAPDADHLELGAEILRVAADLDSLEAQGNSAARALDTLRGRVGRYDPVVLDALAALLGSERQREEIRELPLTSLKVGMVLAADLHLNSGTLLVARGYEISESFLERMRHFPPNAVKEPVRVVLRAN